MSERPLKYDIILDRIRPMTDTEIREVVARRRARRLDIAQWVAAWGLVVVVAVSGAVLPLAIFWGWAE